MAQERTPDDLSFGQVAVDEGYVTREQISEALEIQSKLRSMGVQPKRLGEILVERSIITEGQAQEILNFQKERDSRRKIPGYEIVSVLGRGGMGTVYKALQQSMSRTVALKVLASRHARDPKFIERFFREARAVAKLNHENIIAGIDVGKANNLYYFAMEYVKGETVQEMISRRGAIPEKRAIEIAIQILRALEHADLHNLVHRDIKPQNIIVTEKGVAKLCDLGLAKTEDSEAHITRTGVSMGTPHYISPEQAKGQGDVDIRSDIYSLGASLYHMVVGEVPFVGSSPLVVMTKHITEQAPYPSDVNPKIGDGLSAVIRKSMEKRPEDRYQKPSEMIVDLERVAEGLQPVLVSGRHAPVRGVRRRRRPSSRRARSQRERQEPAKKRTGSSRRRSPSGRGYRRSGRGAGSPRASLRSVAHHESVMFVVFVVVVIFMFAFVLLMGYVSSGQAIIDRIDYDKYVEDNREMEASKALGEARYFDQANPYEDKEVVAAKYQEVVNRYPGTTAAEAAAAKVVEVMQRRK